MVFGSSKKSDNKMKDFTGLQYEGTSTAEEEKSTSFIGKKMQMEGKLLSEDDLIIEGQVKGTVEVNKTLTIGRNGNVTADIHANIVKISGRVKGNITASEKVAILAEGNFNGNIKSQKLVVAEGAILIGNINKEEEIGMETKPVVIPENHQEHQPESGKKHNHKFAKNKSHSPSEKSSPEAETEEHEVIDAEIE